MRTYAVTGALVFTGCVTGCLFPSFDDLHGATSSSTSTSSASGGGSSSSSSSSSSSGDAGPPPGSGVTCGIAQCLIGENCCTTVGGPTCEANAVQDFCGVQGGVAYLCDGNEDCNSNEQCCFDEKTGAKCAETCSGKALCNATVSKCPSGQSCTGSVNGYKACQ